MDTAIHWFAPSPWHWFMLAFVFGLGIMADLLYNKLRDISSQLRKLHDMLETQIQEATSELQKITDRLPQPPSRYLEFGP